MSVPTRTVVQMFLGQPAKMRKGPLMRFQKLHQALIRIGPVKPPARKAQSQHKQVQAGRAMPERYPRLTPVHLTLLPWRGLKPGLRQRLNLVQFP